MIEKKNVRAVNIALVNGLKNSANDRFWNPAGAMVKFGKYKMKGERNIIPEKWYEEYLEIEEKKNKVLEFIILNRMNKGLNIALKNKNKKINKEND